MPEVIKYPKPKLFKPTAEETKEAAQRLVKESMENHQKPTKTTK
jgi:hypothetical protein